MEEVAYFFDNRLDFSDKIRHVPCVSMPCDAPASLLVTADRCADFPLCLPVTINEHAVRWKRVGIQSQAVQKLCRMLFWFVVKNKLKKREKIWQSFLIRLAHVWLPVLLCYWYLSYGAAKVVGRVDR